MKKKLLTAAMALVMVSTLLAGASLAFFTDKDKATNTFTVGNVDITLDEAKVIKDEGTWTATTERVKENSYTEIYPGAYLPKDPTVKNTGKSDAKLLVVIDFSHEDELLKIFPEIETLLGSVIVGFNNNDFKIINNHIDTSATYEVPENHRWIVLEYDGIFEANTENLENGVKVFEGIQVPNSLTNEQLGTLEGLTIEIRAYAVQAEGMPSWQAAGFEGLFRADN